MKNYLTNNSQNERIIIIAPSHSVLRSGSDKFSQIKSRLKKVKIGDGMKIIAKKALIDFWKLYPKSEGALKNWFSITKKSNWNNLVELRKDFPHADLAGNCTIFNISGNKYRLITKIYYESKVVLIRFVLTHAEYDKKPYKDDCEC